MGLNDITDRKQQENEEPVGVVILGCLPFVLGFIWMLIQGLLAL